MKTTLKILTLFCALFLTQNTKAQDNGSAQLAKCKSFTINMLQGDASVSSNLTNCMVNLATNYPYLVPEYNSWMKNITRESKENLDAQLQSLQAQKEQATKNREQSFSNIINNVTQTVQQKAKQSNQNSQNKKSTPYHCDDCPDGTQR